MMSKEKDGVHWMEFSIFQEFPSIIHGVFLKPFDMRLEREYIKKTFGISKLALGNQCHEAHLTVVVQNTEEEEILIKDSCDGLITQLQDVGLVVMHGDCQAVIFYDPVRQVIANVHCGWRGNTHNILGKTVAILKEKLNCDPKDLRVGVSPSLGPNHAEFINYEKEFPEDFYPYQSKPVHFNLWKISYDQLRGQGVLGSHIEISHLCTYEHESSFHSYRREKTAKRNATVIAFKPNISLQ